MERSASGLGPEVIVEVSQWSSSKMLRLVGSSSTEPVADMTGKIVAHCFRQDGLVEVYRKLMDLTDANIKLRSYPELAGLPYATLRRSFDDAVVVGLIRDQDVYFHPSDEDLLRATDQVIIIAYKHSHRTPPRNLVDDLMVDAGDVPHDVPGVTRVLRPKPGSALEAELEKRSAESGHAKQRLDAATAPAVVSKPPATHVLVCGWWSGAADAILELDPLVPAGTSMLILSEPPEDTDNRSWHANLAGLLAGLRNINVWHAVGDGMSRPAVSDAVVNLLAMSGSRPVSGGDAESAAVQTVATPLVHVLAAGSEDSRNLYSLVSAMDVCRELGVQTGHLVFEVSDNALGRQVTDAYPKLNYVSTTELSALLTSQVVENRALNAVWTELLTSGGKAGSAVLMRGAAGVAAGVAGGEAGDAPATTFNQLAEAAALRGEVLIGYKERGGQIFVNPAGKDAPLKLDTVDKLIVIAKPGLGEGFV